MKVLNALILALICVAPAYGQDQFNVEYKLYRSMAPGDTDGNEAVKRPRLGLLEGSLDGDAARSLGFHRIGKYMVWHIDESDVGRRYELVTSPQLMVRAEQDATIQIGQEIPHIVKEKDGHPGKRVQFKMIGTTINVRIAKPTESGADIVSNGEFVTLVSRGKPIDIKDLVGEPVFAKSTWENDSVVPYGAWSFQRVEVQNGHEFLTFARVTRSGAEAADENLRADQYSVEMKLIRVPAERARMVRAAFVYDDDQTSTGDKARVFRAFDRSNAKSNPEPMSVRAYCKTLMQHDVELLTAPRITLNGSQLKRFMSRSGSSGPLDVTLARSPIFKEFFSMDASYLGTISDAAHYKDAEDGPVVGFDGFVFGVHVIPPQQGRDEPIGLDVFLHHQFLTGGRARSLLRKAVPYTFGDQAFRFPKLSVPDDDWIGIEFTSKSTNDLTLLLLDVEKIDQSSARFFKTGAERQEPHAQSGRASSPDARAFSDVTIPEDVEIIVDIVPKIDGENVRLGIAITSTKELAKNPDRAQTWSNVIVRDGDRVVLGVNPEEEGRFKSRILDVQRKDEASTVDPSAQYTVESRLLRVPQEHADDVRAQLQYKNAFASKLGNARAFWEYEFVREPSGHMVASPTIQAYADGLIQSHDAELITSPRITVGSPLFKVQVNHVSFIEKRDPITPKDATQWLKDRNPYFEKFLESSEPFRGAIIDATQVRSHTNGPVIGFDGFLMGTQIHPPDPAGDGLFGLEFFCHHQFVVGREGPGRARADGAFKFGNEVFHFPDLRLPLGGWVGLEFDSSETGDLKILLLSVAEWGLEPRDATKP